MPSPAVAAEPAVIREKVIVALDVPTTERAREIVDQLSGVVGVFKIGLQLFTAGGPEFVRELTDRGVRVFLDLKYHDIPNTVARAAVEASKLGVWMFNVHASGGREMMLRTVESVTQHCGAAGISKPLIVGVTVLTSSDSETLSGTGIVCSVEDQVSRFARLSAEAGLDGVVASSREVGLVRASVVKPGFLTVTPGIRPAGATKDDQRRVNTIGGAIAAGSDYVVIGRPIVEALDPLAAVESLIREAVETK